MAEKEIDKLIKAMAEDERRESPVGSHFLSVWMSCKWKFFLRYVMGFRPTGKKPAFSFGSAIHEARATFYNTDGDTREMTNTFLSEMDKERLNYYQAGKWRADYERGPGLLEAWANTYGWEDLADCEVLGVEESFVTQLPNDYYRTARVDTILRNKKTGKSFIVEAKTTGFAPYVMMSSVENGDQVTDYLWHTRHHHPEWNVQYAVADIMYQKGSSIQCIRGDHIYRSPTQIDAYVRSTMQELSEMTQKTLALSTSGQHTPESLFSRNTSQCIAFNSKCEFMDICRLSNLNVNDVPHGFDKDPWQLLDPSDPDPTGLFNILQGKK